MASSKKDKYLESAQRFMLKGQLDKAIKEYQQVVALEPKEIRYRQKLAELLVRDARTGEAIAQYEDIGKHYADNSYFLKAIAVYKQIQRLDPGNIGIQLTLASLNHKQGLVGNALAEYGQVVAYYEKEGALKEAVKVVEQMLSIDGEHAATRLKYAELLFTSGATDASYQAFEALLSSLQRKKDRSAAGVEARMRELFPDREKEDFSSIEAKVAAGDCDGAIASLQEVLRSDSRDLAAWQLLCEAESRRGNSAGVRRAYQQMMKLFPDDLGVVQGVIRAEIESGEYSGALRLLELQLPRFLQKDAAGQAESLLLMLPSDAASDTRVADGLRRIYQATGDREKLAALAPAAEQGAPVDLAEDPQHASLGVEPSAAGAAELPDPFAAAVPASAGEAPAAAPASAAAPFPWEEEIELDLDDDGAPPATGENSIDLPLDLSLPLDVNEVNEQQAAADLQQASPFDEPPASEPAPFSVTASPLAEASSSSEAPSPFDDSSSYGDLSFLSESAGSEDGDGALELTLPDDAEFPDIDWSEQPEEATSPELAAPPEAAGAGSSDPLAAEPEGEESAEPADEPDLPELEDEPAESAASAAASLGWVDIFPCAAGDPADSDLAELESHYDLGVGYKEMGLYGKAISEFALAAANPQRRLDCLTLQAMCYRESGEMEKAHDLLQRGRELDVISGEERMALSYELAFLLERAGSAEQAIELYREVHAVDPAYSDVAARLTVLTGEEQLDFIDLELEDGEF